MSLARLRATGSARNVGLQAALFKLPKHLRDRIWEAYEPGQEIDMSPSREYLDVAREVETWIREHGGG